MRTSGFFISQVGQQPASVASALTTMASAGLVKEGFLLSSAKTQVAAEAIAVLLLQTNPQLKVTLVPQQNYKNAKNLATALKTYASAAPQDPIYVNLAGGMSYFWAMVSRLVWGVGNIYPVFSTRDSVVCLRSEQTWDLKNLGLEPLLALYGLQGRWLQTDKPHLVSKLVITSAHDAQIETHFDFAYESKGYLYGLHENIETLAQARAVIDIHHKATGLNGLKPVILATTSQNPVFRRLQQTGCDALLFTKSQKNAATEKLEKWFAGQPGTPGQSLPSYALENQCPPARPLTGAGGENDPLLVCLGNDPSPTLSALYSHRPSEAFILYDATTPRIRFMASNLARISAQLPVNRVSFVRVGPGHLGKGINADDLAHLLKTPTLCANVTPGSKAQAWALGQLYDVALYSIVTHPVARIAALFAENAKERWVDPGPPAVMGQVVGGQGAQPRLQAEDLRARRELLTGVARCLERGSDPKGNFWFFKPQKPLHRTFGNLILQTRWQNDLVSVDLKEGEHWVRGTFTAPMEKKQVKADWLEDVVGGAFLEAGGKDLLVGMTWPWGKSLNGRAHRTEIDVVFTWRHVHCVVSVKACPLNPQKIEEKCLEIRAMASECFGRFALPILVYYAPRDKDIEWKSLDYLQGSKVLLVPANLLCHPDRLKQLLDDGLLGQSTTFKPAPAGDSAGGQG